MTKIEIDKDEPLQPGDIIELHYKTMGLTWIRATQAWILESRLQNKPNFKLINCTYNENNLVLQCRIIEPREQELQVQEAGIVSTALIIKAVAVVSCGILIWLSLDKIYKIVESPAGKIAVGGLGTMALAAGIVALLAILSKTK